jgi:group I intron endonuclease
MKLCGVYKIQSVVKPERCYIGSSKNICSRWNQHLNALKCNKHRNKKLQNHYNKYGKNDLVFSILIDCEINKLIKIEQFFINSEKPWFNTRKIADSNIGVTHTIEYKIKESLDRLGDKNPFFGKKHSEESKRLKREWNLAHNIKPPVYHGGRPKGTKNKNKKICQQ